MPPSAVSVAPVTNELSSLVGGMGTIEGPVLGALVLFGLQEELS